MIMIPTIQIVKEILESLENDSYLDVNISNPIVIDDQMIEARKDNQIVNLFTKGSHHRNLSVFLHLHITYFFVFASNKQLSLLRKRVVQKYMYLLSHVYIKCSKLLLL